MCVCIKYKSNHKIKKNRYTPKVNSGDEIKPFKRYIQLFQNKVGRDKKAKKVGIIRKQVT